jgi:hypothetical protein
VGRRSTWVGVAISVTALDAAVATYYGSSIWEAFGIIIWSKLLLLLLCAVWGTTLLHVWAYACSQLRHPNRGRAAALLISVEELSPELSEEIDV